MGDERANDEILKETNEALTEGEEGAIPDKDNEETPKEKVTPAADEPEFDIDGEKVKLSQIKEWKKGYMLQSDYTTKTQELAQQRKELEDLIKFADYLKSNPKKLEKVLEALEDKVEETREMTEEELAGLDPDDPYAKLLKKTLDTVKRLEAKIADYERRESHALEEQLITQAQQVLSRTLEETAKSLKFDDEEEKSTWRMMVLSYLKDNPRDYKDEEDFVSTIKEIGKKYFDAINKIGEAKIKKYLESKKTPAPPTSTGAVGAVLKKKPTIDNLQESIEELLAEEEKT